MTYTQIMFILESKKQKYQKNVDRYNDCTPGTEGFNVCRDFSIRLNTINDIITEVNNLFKLKDIK